MGQKFTIIESKWYRGHTACGSALEVVAAEDSDIDKRYDGCQCCLGQLACAMGYTSDEIRGITMPFQLPCSELFFPLLVENKLGYNGMYNTTSKLASQIAKANDNEDLTDDERKAELILLFAKMGFDLEFAP